MTTIRFSPPSPQAPGYLARVRKALEYQSILVSDVPAPEILDRLVDFLVDYVSEPVDREQAKEALWQASQEQYDQLLRAITGKSAEGDGNLP